MKTNFKASGVITALVTPFKENKIDLIALEKLIKFQLDANIDAILLFGTTGEPLSLTESEKRIIFFTAKEIISNKVPIFTGISSPITSVAIKSAISFEKQKSDALLVITPYYYKCLQDGIYQHFNQIAKATKLPIIVYNVPSRTNFDLTKNCILLDKICKIDTVKAIKLAENNPKRIVEITKKSKLPILCGCDEHALLSYKYGAAGCISVISNAFPNLMKNIFLAISKNNTTEAEKYEKRLKPLLNVFSSLPNPIAIKYLLSKTLKIENKLRLPLTKLDEVSATIIDDLLLKEKNENTFN